MIERHTLQPRQKLVTSLAKKLIDINNRNPGSSRIGFKIESSAKETERLLEHHAPDIVDDAIRHVHKPGRGILLAAMKKSKSILLKHGARLSSTPAANKHIMHALRRHNLTVEEAYRAGLPHNHGILTKIKRFFKGL